MTTGAEASSSTAVIDAAALLSPIPGGNPAGENLQYDGLHDDIREARRADEILEQGDWKHEPKTADWREVVRLCSEALAGKTKDLQVGAWLAEALVKLHGFAGLRDGLKIMRGLQDQFWDSVYPEIDEGDMEARANSLAWLDRQTAMAIREVAIARTSAGEGYSYIQLEDSKEFDIPENQEGLDYEQTARITELKARAAEERKITSEDWRKARNTTRRAFYEEAYSLLNECWAEFNALDKVMDEKFDRQTPGLGALKKSLDDVRSQVERLVKEKRLLEPDPVETAPGGESQAPAAGDSSLTTSIGPIRARQDALRMLSQVAEFFRKTEPHSPVSYLVQRAVKWGEMPLDAWLKDVIKDGGVLDGLRETLGLNTPSGGGGDGT